MSSFLHFFYIPAGVTQHVPSLCDRMESVGSPISVQPSSSELT